MNQAQIDHLMATEHRDTTSPRQDWWHYRRTPATRTRDAIWQRGRRTIFDEGWRNIPTPPTDVLERLEPCGFMTITCTRWQGFHDPAEYAAGN